MTFEAVLNLGTASQFQVQVSILSAGTKALLFRFTILTGLWSALDIVARRVAQGCCCTETDREKQREGWQLLDE